MERLNDVKEPQLQEINEVLDELCVEKSLEVETLLWATSKGEYDE